MVLGRILTPLCHNGAKYPDLGIQTLSGLWKNPIKSDSKKDPTWKEILKV